MGKAGIVRLTCTEGPQKGQRKQEVSKEEKESEGARATFGLFCFGEGRWSVHARRGVCLTSGAPMIFSSDGGRIQDKDCRSDLV